MLKRVLVIDDDPVFCEVVRTALEREGVQQTSVVHNARDALDMLQRNENQFDLIVLDLNIPEFDGVELLGEFKNLPYTGAIAIVSAEPQVVVDVAQNLATQYGLNVIDSVNKPLSKRDIKRWLTLLNS